MARKRLNQPGAIGFGKPPEPAGNAGSQRGFSLYELLFVVIIIGLLATVVYPSKGSGESTKLDLAAMEIADAIRFARDEALRLGVPMGVRQQSGAKRIRVFSMNTLTSPATPVYDIYHPIDKHIYDRNLGQAPFDFAGDIVATPTFRGSCNAPENIFFDGGGTPWCADPDTVLVENLAITLTLGSDVRDVTLHGINGRVTVE